MAADPGPDRAEPVVVLLWDLTPYLVGALWAVCCALGMRHACLHGTANFASIEAGTPRYRYCFESLPTTPWLVVALPSAALLAAGAAVIRRHRLISWAFVLMLSTTTALFVLYVDQMDGNLTI